MRGPLTLSLALTVQMNRNKIPKMSLQPLECSFVRIINEPNKLISSQQGCQAAQLLRYWQICNAFSERP